MEVSETLSCFESRQDKAYPVDFRNNLKKQVIIMVAEIVRRLSQKLPVPTPADLSDYNGELNLPLELLPMPLHQLRPAAVLVPIIKRSSGPTVLLTQRTSHLRAHAGQISFPGGGAEPEDVDAVATALREAYEEVGIPTHAVEIAGFLDPHVTVSGYCVTPVVGFVDPDFRIVADPGEVAEVFEVPLEHVLNAENHQIRTGRFKNKELSYYVIQYQHRTIWGATAGMLVNLHRKLRD